MKVIILLISIILPLTLTQCASFDLARRVRQQGNLLPQNKVERLKKGMSKEEVAILMGTSLISPLFNNNRWDYAYTWRQGMGKMEIRTVVLYFSNNRLTAIEHHNG